MEQSCYIDEVIVKRLGALDPITLEEMTSIKLMNRTDIKFVTNKDKLSQLLSLAYGKYYAQFHNGKRIASYMTQYWDTPVHTYYYQHHNGRSPRQKIRVRTYMDSQTTFLEVKTKNNRGRTKKKRIEISGQQDIVSGNDFLLERVQRDVREIMPTVCNSFKRITLVNKGKTERLTIDFDICFFNCETKRQTGTGDLVIIELKRDGNMPSPVLDMLRELRIKPSGFSKYCIGSVLTNVALKHNLFKPRLTRIAHLVGHDLRRVDFCSDEAEERKIEGEIL